MNPVKETFQKDLLKLRYVKSQKYVSYTSCLCMGILNRALQNWYTSTNYGPKIIMHLINLI
jgi:hypothetical protein